MLSALRRTWSDVKFYTKVFVQRKLFGYSHFDVWELASNNSARMAKLLTEYKKTKHGFPTYFLLDYENPSKEDSEQASAKWDEVLDDLIFYHMVVAGLPRPKDTIGLDTTLSNIKTWDTYDTLALTPEEKHRYRKGKYYMWKYYEALWS